MNKYILILGVLSLVLFVDSVSGAGWTRSAGESLWTLIGGNIYRDSSVGIGTGGDPDSKLHIKSEALTLTEIRIQNAGGGDSEITWYLGTNATPTREWSFCSNNAISDNLLLINGGSDCNSDSMIQYERGGITVKKGAFTYGDITTIIGASFSTRYENFFKTQNFLSTTITTFSYGMAGQVIYIICDAGTTIQDNAGIHLSGGVDFVCSNDDTITLIFEADSRDWYELSRSVN